MKTMFITMLLLSLQAADNEMTRIEEWAKTQPDSGPGRIGVGDEYYKAVKKFPKEKARFMEKANEWWAKGWPDLDAVWKEKTRESLKKIFATSAPSKGVVADWKGEKVTASGERVHSGMFASKIQFPKGNEGNWLHMLKWEGQLPNNVVEVVVTAWVLSDGTNSVNDDMKPHLTGPNGEIIYSTGTPIPMDFPLWKKLEVKVPAKGASTLRLFFEFQSRLGTVYVDDVSVKADGKELLLNGGFEK
jgi:hypothetical protein